MTGKYRSEDDLAGSRSYRVADSFCDEGLVVLAAMDKVAAETETNLARNYASHVSSRDLTARAFFPRVLIGEYLQSQFEDLGAKARKAGHLVEVLTNCRVDDISPGVGTGAKAEVNFTAGHEPKKAQFDDVVIASGHSWPEKPEIHGISLVSPWPYTRITNLDQPAIGVLGSSLSAIDIVIALGHARGTFDEIGNQVRWLPNDADAAFRITMVSHMGIMPEGDFYYPFPYEHLKRLTPEAINEDICY